MRQTFFAISTIASVANCLSVKQDGEALKKIHVTMDGQPLDLYIAGTYWSEIGNSSSPATYGPFRYSGQCSTEYDGECNGCDCRWSWNREGTWDPSIDSSARCRCKEPFIPSSDYDMGFNSKVIFSKTEYWDNEFIRNLEQELTNNYSK